MDASLVKAVEILASSNNRCLLVGVATRASCKSPRERVPEM
jgi:hypothetical protein